MGKIIRKLNLMDIYNLDQYEKWLSSMAKEGLHLKKIGTIFIYFEEREKSETEYKIDFIKKSSSKEEINKYQSRGWDLITNSGKFHIFANYKNLDSFKTHADNNDKKKIINILYNHVRKELVFIVIGVLLCVSIILSGYYSNKQPYLFLIKGQFEQILFAIILQLYGIKVMMCRYLVVRNQKKRLIDGSTIHYNDNVSKTKLSEALAITILTCSGFLLTIVPSLQIVKGNDYTLPKGNTNLPIVRLVDIEGNGEYTRKEIDINGVDWANRVSYNWSLMAPVQYEVVESGIISNEMWDDGSGKYSPSIRTEFYKVIFSRLAKNITFDLIDRYNNENTKIKKIYISQINNEIYVLEEGINKQIFAYLDNKVIHIKYYGKKDIDYIIPLVIKKLIMYE